jgi:hypothetical protein
MAFPQGTAGTAGFGVQVLVNGTLVDNGVFGEATIGNPETVFQVMGDLLLQISAANAVVRFNAIFSVGNSLLTQVSGGCRIIFTRLQ